MSKYDEMTISLDLAEQLLPLIQSEIARKEAEAEKARVEIQQMINLRGLLDSIAYGYRPL